MSEHCSIEQYQAAIESRMASGEPFTYGELCRLRPRPFGEDGRTAEKTIQRWRRKGLIKIDGRIDRAPRWVLVSTTPDRKEGQG